MATHDADKNGATPADRRTMTRDPNSPGGAIVESGQHDKDGNAITIAGSTHMTANIDGLWFVVNTRGEKLVVDAYQTEHEAVSIAQQFNR